MYPIFRMAKTQFQAHFMPEMKIGDVHVSRHVCWPWDLDVFMELNNGRILTLYDLGRFALGRRIGLMKTLRLQKWGLAVAGTSIRYRRRITVFQRFEMRTRALCRDERFVYMQQSIWRNGECASSALLRTAVINKDGIVPTQDVAEALGTPDWNPATPTWAQAWIDAEAQRVWPPEI